MKFLFIGDPLLGLNPLGDSSLAIVRAVQNQKVECFWVTPENLWQRGADIWAAAERLEPFLKDRLPTTSGNQKKELSEFDAIFIRKDPPFNTDYVRLCWSLALYDKQIFQFNRAQLLLRFHEKMVPFEACRQGYLKNEDLVPTFIVAVNRAESWAKEFGYDEMVVKPYLGHAGESITRLRLGDLAKSKFTETMMIQPLLQRLG